MQGEMSLIAKVPRRDFNDRGTDGAGCGDSGLVLAILLGCSPLAWLLRKAGVQYGTGFHD
jgi:hypothetical protein